MASWPGSRETPWHSPRVKPAYAHEPPKVSPLQSDTGTTPPSPWGEPHHPAEVCTQRWVLGAAWLLKKSSCASCHHRGHESPEVSCLSLPSLSPSPLLSSSTQNWPQSDLSCNSLHAPVSLTMEARQNPVVWGMLHSWPPPVAPTPLRSRAKLPPAPSCGFAGPRAQRTTCPQM